MNDLSRLWAWISERELIRIRKERGSAEFFLGWTDDTILAKYRFCNVRREDDRVTKWISDNIRKPFHNHPLLWHMLLIARTINWPPTLAYLIEEMWPNLEVYNPGFMSNALIRYQSAGHKTFTGAYMIRAESDRKQPWFNWPKVKYISEIVCGKLWEERDQWARYWMGTGGIVGEHLEPTLELTHRRLMNHTGWGPFMAYQAVVDMRFTSLLDKAPDRTTWCAAGPGTIRGLNRLAGRELKAPLKQDRALKEILEIWARWKTEQEPLWEAVQPDFSDVPNCLCEFDKYERVRLGQGEPRALYVSHGAVR